MSKKIFAALIVAVVATFAGYNIYQSQRVESIMSDLTMANVEALAGGEHVTNLGCLGDGSVDCPINHIKVEYVVQGFSLGE